MASTVSGALGARPFDSHDAPGVLHDVLERGVEPLAGERAGEDAVGECAEVLERRPQVLLRLVQPRCSAASTPLGLHELQVERQRGEALLGAVVQVLLEPPALGVARRDDEGARRAQLAQPRGELGGERLVLEREPGRLGQRAGERRIVEQPGTVTRDGKRASLGHQARVLAPRCRRQRDRRAIRADEGAGAVQRIAELQRRVAERAGERGPQPAGRVRRGDARGHDGERVAAPAARELAPAQRRGDRRQPARLGEPQRVRGGVAQGVAAGDPLHRSGRSGAERDEHGAEHRCRAPARRARSGRSAAPRARRPARRRPPIMAHAPARANASAVPGELASARRFRGHSAQPASCGCSNTDARRAGDRRGDEHGAGKGGGRPGRRERAHGAGDGERQREPG